MTPQQLGGGPGPGSRPGGRPGPGVPGPVAGRQGDRGDCGRRSQPRLQVDGDQRRAADGQRAGGQQREHVTRLQGGRRQRQTRRWPARPDLRCRPRGSGRPAAAHVRRAGRRRACHGGRGRAAAAGGQLGKPDREHRPHRGLGQGRPGGDRVRGEQATVPVGLGDPAACAGDVRADPGRPAVDRRAGGDLGDRAVRRGDPVPGRAGQDDRAGPPGHRAPRPASWCRHRSRSPVQCGSGGLAGASRGHRSGNAEAARGHLSECAGRVGARTIGSGRHRQKLPAAAASSGHGGPASWVASGSTVERGPPRDQVRCRVQGLSGRHRRRVGTLPGDSHREPHGVRRTVRLRQDHLAPDDQPDDRADRRHGVHRRRRHPQRRRADTAPRHRLRDPERRAVPAPHDRRQRHHRAGPRGPQPPGRAHPGSGTAGARRARPGDGQPIPLAALRRPAAAGRGRPRAGRRSAGDADGRAVLGGRPGRPHPAAGGVPAAAGRARQDHRLRHPRHRRGGQARRPDRGVRGRRSTWPSSPPRSTC